MTRAAPWYRHAVFYEVRVRSFSDGDGDGIGDFTGLTSALDYLAELGVDALWLMPMFPSPGLDDGYDVADYCAVAPELGTLEDFRAFMAAAHARGIRVILDLVLNHTSDQHPWFVESRSSRGSAKREWYVWSDDDMRYSGVRLMFSGVESSNWAWDEGSGQYYWHRFFRQQPDLNFDHPPVREAIWEVLRFWLELGIDGFRVDAVPYLVEREGTSCEGLPETHAVMRELRRRMDERFPGRVLLAEACQTPEELLPYFGEGDEFHMAFHFPLVPKLFLALLRENREPVERALANTPALPGDCQWGLFLRNHDEMSLALETPGERDELLAAFAPAPEARIYWGIRRRLASMLGHDARRIRLLHAILLTLPGSPFLFYGDELLMPDDLRLPDRYGLRLPVRWEGEGHESVASHRGDPSSWWNDLRHMLRARRGARGLGTGALHLTPSPDPAVLAYTRALETGSLLFVGNLSATARHAVLRPFETRGVAFVDPLGGEGAHADEAGVLRLELGPFEFRWLHTEARA